MSRPPAHHPATTSHPFFLVRWIEELFEIGPAAALAAALALLIVLVGGTIGFISSAPPSVIAMTSGPENSVFHRMAKRYGEILKRNGVTLKILTSEGSIENLTRLSEHHAKAEKVRADIGLVQVGTVSGTTSQELVSLGSIAYQPILVFYRGKPLNFLSELRGKKISIGPEGSGERNFALSLLGVNGVHEKDDQGTSLLGWEAKTAAQALIDRKIDAAFIMSENASVEILHKLLNSREIELFDFRQAKAYVRKIDYLSHLELPEGSINFEHNIPSHDIQLVGPMLELVATKHLHPAISDLLLEAATEIHGKPGLLQKRGEFPSPIEHAIPMSEDANRYYKSGKSFFYRHLPFWLASLVSRLVVVVFPLLVVLIPILRSLPAFFRWKTQRKIHRRYDELLELEREYLSSPDAAARDQITLQARFDRIENAVNRMRISASFADQFYELRGHIDYVRKLMTENG